MNKSDFFMILLSILILIRYGLSTVIGATEANETKTDEVLSRQKRFLTFFPNGGLVKCVLGILIPVQLLDMRSLNMAHNFQAQFLVPPNLYLPNRAPLFTTKRRSLETQRQNFDMFGEYEPDNTRLFVYSSIELMMNRRGKNGKECLLKAICQVAESSYKHNGLIGELIDLLFTPGEEKLSKDYYDAKMAGLHVADCQKLFSKCPFGEGILDTITGYF